MSQDTTNFDLVFVTNVEHLHTLSLGLESLLRLYAFKAVHIVTSRKYFKFFAHLQTICGPTPLHLLDEDTVLPGMALANLREKNLPCFPKRAGWYFQQFLKLGMSKLESISDNYVVVDADTIFLKKLPFSDSEGKYVFTISDEFHQPYFENYALLMNEKANREFSFISQYMVFNKAIVNSIVTKIEMNFNYSKDWYWLIIENIEGDGASLFSEYETYGHYVKSHYPERSSYLKAPWLRLESNSFLSYFPTRRAIASLPEEYYYVSYEQRANTISGKITKRLCKTVIPYLLRLRHQILG
ncbi:MAG: hypothetical protein H7Y36_11825 [Armatimonadetes bacterium]|nr:hypothetical protein [Akkermansiaceae bacterium]